MRAWAQQGPWGISGPAGVDSHKDTIHVAVITCTRRPVDDQEFSTTEVGYRQAVTWLGGHGPPQAVGVEGTSSYGTGVCAALTKAGVTVVEVNRTRAAERRNRGKTDPLDAHRAARSVLSGRQQPIRSGPASSRCER